ncbi:TIGR04283 family arsenosugar biosynthesis glycosyltransferase [Candidatus Omnitrophota bacterium]
MPIYNEEKVLADQAAYFKKLSKQGELIFVDGGSCDRSVEIARHYGRVLRAQKGRARQMNWGGRFAKGVVLLFLHADTTVEAQALKDIESRTKAAGIIGGCLTQRIDAEALSYRFIEQFGNVRARLSKVFYGDQGIFVRKDIFERSNGFPEVPIMEDVLFSRNLKRLGQTAVLKHKVNSSARRWNKNGILRTAMLYSSLNILFWLKFPLNEIKRRYQDLR